MSKKVGQTYTLQRYVYTDEYQSVCIHGKFAAEFFARNIGHIFPKIVQKFNNQRGGLRNSSQLVYWAVHFFQGKEIVYCVLVRSFINTVDQFFPRYSYHLLNRL